MSSDFETVTNAVTAYLKAAGIEDVQGQRRLCARVIRAARNAQPDDPSRSLVELALVEARRVVTSYVVPTRRLVETATPITVPTKMPPQRFQYWQPFQGSTRLREAMRAVAAEQARPAAIDVGVA